MVGGEHTIKISALQLLRFGIDSVLKILKEGLTQIMTDSINQLITKVFVEQPRLNQVCL